MRQTATPIFSPTRSELDVNAELEKARHSEGQCRNRGWAFIKPGSFRGHLYHQGFEGMGNPLATGSTEDRSLTLTAFHQMVIDFSTSPGSGAVRSSLLQVAKIAGVSGAPLTE